MAEKFRCEKCKLKFRWVVGPVVCPKCKHNYVKWVSYSEKKDYK